MYIFVKYAQAKSKKQPNNTEISPVDGVRVAENHKAMRYQHLFLVLVVLFTQSALLAQTKWVQEQLQSIEGQWSFDDNQNISYVKVVELPELTKDVIYTRVKSFLAYNYNDANSVIQEEDKEAGLVIAKGLFRLTSGIEKFLDNIHTWHIIRVDIKEGRARLILTLTEYKVEYYDSTSRALMNQSTTRIFDQYPNNPDGRKKTVFAEALYKSHNRANETLTALEKAIREGNTLKGVENSDW